MDRSTAEFVEENLWKDVLSLKLQSKKYPFVDMRLAIKQIEGKQKIINKVPLFFKHPDILYPNRLSVEQASSAWTAKYKSDLSAGSNFVDLTGGFGVDFYYLSQHFEHGVYVEQDEQLCRLAEHNFVALGIQSFEVKHQQAEAYLASMSNVDLIYIDPHRRGKSGVKTVRISDCEPNVANLATSMLEKSKKVMIKLSPMLDMRQAIKDIPQITEIHIIAVDNECKEVLLLLQDMTSADQTMQEVTTKGVSIKTINFLKNGSDQRFDFQLDTEVTAEASYVSSPLQYLYEPNAAIMKSGAFKSVAEKFELKKFHPNTHLYTDDVLKTDFPGRVFAIQEVVGNTKNDFTLLKQKYPKANIATRNYPLTVEAYKTKSGIKDGGEVYLFALKASDDNLLSIVCSKIDPASFD